jgi:hypothetical protein
MTGKHACFLITRGIQEATNSTDFTVRTTATKCPGHLRATARESGFSEKGKLVRQAFISCLVSPVRVGLEQSRGTAISLRLPAMSPASLTKGLGLCSSSIARQGSREFPS